MRGLALDLGTTTGWALYENGVIASGSWVLATEKELREMRKGGLARCCDPRILKLDKEISWVDHFCHPQRLDWIIFEDILFCKSQAQAQLWASFRGVVMLRCRGTKVIPVPVQTLKKFATGSGAADKDRMKRALQMKEPALYKPEADDNEVDAVWLLRYAISNYVPTITAQTS